MSKIPYDFGVPLKLNEDWSLAWILDRRRGVKRIRSDSVASVGNRDLLHVHQQTERSDPD
jgi:hypothetical protein